jgi:hypothetical protein
MVGRSRFLLTWSVALVTMLALVAGFNAVVNPYDVFAWRRIPGINVRKPATRDHAALAKAYQVERARPATVVLGTSRAFVGIDAASPIWPEADRPIYNYGIAGSNMSEVLLRELRQAWSTGRLRHAVAILDLPAFLTPDPKPDRGPDERRLMFLDDGSPNSGRLAQYADDAFLSVLSLGALEDSVTTILGQGRGDRVSDLTIDGTATVADFADVARAEGMNALFTQKDIFDLARIGGYKRTLADWHGPMPNIGLLREAVRFCLEHHISLTLILGASHVDQLEIYRRAGLWPYVEQLKVDLATLAAEANSDTITAWDFLEFSPYTTEPVPPEGDRMTSMRWFWEPVHFKKALGEVMLQRVFSAGPADFGVPLTVATVAARNLQVREQQRPFIGWRIACEANRQTKCTPPADASSEAAR